MITMQIEVHILKDGNILRTVLIDYVLGQEIYCGRPALLHWWCDPPIKMNPGEQFKIITPFPYIKNIYEHNDELKLIKKIQIFIHDFIYVKNHDCLGDTLEKYWNWRKEYPSPNFHGENDIKKLKSCCLKWSLYWELNEKLCALAKLIVQKEVDNIKS